VNVGHRNFRRGHEVEIPVLQFEQIFLELRKLPGTEQAGAVHDERRQHLGVSVPPGMDIQHERDKSALQRGAHFPVEGEPGSGDLCRTFEIEDPQRFAYLPVGFRLESQLRFAPPCFRHRIVLLVRADGNRFVRHVRNQQEKIPEMLLDDREFLVQRFDPPGDLLHFLDQKG